MSEESFKIKTEAFEESNDNNTEKPIDFKSVSGERQELGKEKFPVNYDKEKIKKIRESLGINGDKPLTNKEKKEIIKREGAERIKVVEKIYSDNTLVLPSDIQSIFSHAKSRTRETLMRSAGALIFTFAGFIGALEHKKTIDNNLVNQDTGMSLEKIKNSTESNVSVDIYSKNSHKYVYHIGQVHYRPGTEASQKDTKEVIDSQKKVEKILNIISKINKGKINVFSEGVTAESYSVVQSYKNKADEVDEIKPDKDCYKKLNNLFFNQDKGFDGPGVALIYHLFSKKLKSLEDDFKNKLPKMNNKEKGEFNKNKAEIEEFCKNVEKDGGEDLFYLYFGAEMKEYVDGNINILPAEGKEFNDPSLHKEVGKVEKLINSSKDFSHPIKAAESLIKYVVTDKSKMNFAMGNERENSTLNTVTSNKKNIEQKIIPLVFGTSHDFSDNIAAYNNLHKNEKLNLVKIDTE